MHLICINMRFFKLLIFLTVSSSTLVISNNQFEARLVGGPFSNEGRLEVRNSGGEWGSFCKRGSRDLLELACGLCRTMGFLASHTASNTRSDYGTADGVIWYKGGSCHCGRSPCILRPWDIDYTSCDHRTDLSMTCLTDGFRLSNGSSNREGWLQVGLGGDRWANVVQEFPHSMQDADLVCQHFGYPLALAVSNDRSTYLPITPVGTEPEQPVVKNACYDTNTTLESCLSASVCANTCGLIPGTLPVFGVKCATVADVLAANDTSKLFPDGIERRLENEQELSGVLQLRHTGNDWVDACFYDSDRIMDLASDVCGYYGSLIVRSEDLLPAEIRSADDVQFLFRVDRHNGVHWLKVQNQCAKNGGFVLKISCKKGFTLNGITVFLPDTYTCVDRCGIPPSPQLTCGCDPLCHVFRDCCPDVLTACPPDDHPSDDGSLRQQQRQSDIHNLTNSSQYYQCLAVRGVQIDNQLVAHYQLVGRCPESWEDTAVRDYCETPQFTQPILYDAGDRIHIPFKNAMCALCHGLRAWRAVPGPPIDDYPEPMPELTPVLTPVYNIDEDGNVSLAIQPIPAVAIPPRVIIPRPLELAYFSIQPIESYTDAAYLHFCKLNDIVGYCSRDTHSQSIREACAAYTAEVFAKGDPRTFKNPHCALCNGLELSDIIFVSQSSEEGYEGYEGHGGYDDYRDDPYHAEFEGPEPIILRLPLAITLGEELLCVRRDFTVSIKVQDPSVSRSVLGGSSRHSTPTAAIECLFRAVAFKNIDIAEYLIIALEQVIVSDNITEPTARVSLSGFRFVNELKAIFDDILLADEQGDGSQKTDWKTRCNTKVITLEDGCDFPTDQVDEGRAKCIQTTKNVTAVTINGTQHLYISTGTLITPLNVSLVTVYGTDYDPANSTKFKFTHVCGVNPTNMSCEILPVNEVEFSQDGDNRVLSHKGVVFNGSSFALLPDGHVMVCTYKLLSFIHPLATPEYILKVVCSCLSLVALSATIVTYCVFSTLRNIHGLRILGLSAAMFFGQLLFLFNSGITNAGVCVTVAVIAHYAWLAAFAWMTVMAWDFMCTFTAPLITRSKTTRRFAFVRPSLIGWGSPLLVLIPCLVINFCDCTGLNFSYGRVETKICWIYDSTAILVTFGAPIALSLCLNIVFFLLTVRAIWKSKRNTSLINKEKSRRKEASKELLIYIKISSVMGFAWIIGFAALMTGVDVLWYLFTICAPLQGVFIFTSFGFNRRVRGLWRDKLCRKRAEDTTGIQSSNHVVNTASHGTKSNTCSTSF